MVKQSPEFFMNLFDESLEARRSGSTGSVLVEPYLLGSEAFKLDLPTYIGRSCERLRLSYGTPNHRYGINLIPVIGDRSDGISVTYIQSEYSKDYRLVPYSDGEVQQHILSNICRLLPNPNSLEAA